MPTTLGERIRYAREHRQMDQSQLAREIKAKPQNVAYLEKKGRRTGYLLALARALQVRLEWLDSDESELNESAFVAKAPESGSPLPEDSPMIIDALISGRLPPLMGADEMPVWTGARAGEHGEVFLEDGPVDYIPKPPNLVGVQEAYGMIVIGESMRPKYEPHQIIHVNPTRRPVPGKGVVVWLVNNGVLVKEFARRTPTHVILREYRPKERELQVPVESISKLHLIVGTEEGA